MSDSGMLIFLSLVMLVGSFLAGNVPLIMTLSEVSCHLSTLQISLNEARLFRSVTCFLSFRSALIWSPS